MVAKGKKGGEGRIKSMELTHIHHYTLNRLPWWPRWKKNLPAVWDLGFIPELGRSSRRRHGNIVFSVQPGQEQVPALTSCYVSRRDLPYCLLTTQGKGFGPTQTRLGNLVAGSHPSLSHLCALVSSVTTQSFPFHSSCAADMPSCLVECL